MATFNHPNTPENSTTFADALRVLGHPDDVLSRPNLTTAEKREVLAAWASDAHAVVDSPGLRQLDSGSIVSVDEVLRALRALDASDAGRPSTAPTPRPRRRRRPTLSRLLVTLRSRDDDDDDPPPSPAAALPPGLAFALRRKWEPSGHAEPVAA